MGLCGSFSITARSGHLNNIISDTDVDHLNTPTISNKFNRQKLVMLGDLSTIEIEDLLHTQCIGRIGCHDQESVYVVPISYAYENNSIYCHAYEGKKIDIMRKNPGVCFQVDEMKDMANWKSVIAWGEFEELNGDKEKIQALLLLLHRQLPMPSSITTHLGKSWPFTPPNTQELVKIPGITFRISLRKKTGRFESTSESPMLA
jgi:hypothetical protein